MTENTKRQLPQNELDFHLMTTDAVWGKAEVSPELRRRLNQYFLERLEDGTDALKPSSLWDTLGYFTRDIRLANLSAWNGEIQYCQHYLDLAGDFLQVNMIQAFIVCLERVASTLELSQSKGGFLRRIMNTLRTEHVNTETEPPKKALFGSNKKDGQGGY